MRILLAEADAGVRETTRLMLEELGHEVVAIEDGRKAWDLLSAEHSFDLVISDTGMPEMNGVELLTRVRLVSALPFVLVSALPGLNGVNLTRFTQANRAVFIQKGGIGLEEIERAISDAVAISAT